MRWGRAAEAALVLWTLAIVFTGIGWGLPSFARVERLLPPERARDPQMHARLAESRRELYRKMEQSGRLPVDYVKHAIVVEPGAGDAQMRVLNAYRSYFLRSANGDEQKSLTYLAHMKPREWNFEPYGIDYGGAYLYPLGGLYAVLRAFGFLAVDGDLTAYFEDPSRMARIFLAGRIFNAICFLLVVLMVYRIGGTFAGRAGALSGAALFAAAPVLTLNSHTLNPYGWATLWFLVAFERAERFLDGGGRAPLAASAAAVGMCAGSSMAFLSAGSLLAAPLLLAALRRMRVLEAVFQFAAAVGIAGVVFIFTNPYLFLRFELFADQILFLTNAFPFAPNAASFVRFFGAFLPPNWGWLQTFLAVAACAAVVCRAEAPVQLAAFSFAAAVFYLGGRGLDDYAHGRHFLPFFSLGAALIGWLLFNAVAQRLRRFAAVVALLAVLEAAGPSLSYVARFARESSSGASRIEAGDWINDRIAPGESIGLVKPPQYNHTPPFRFDRYRLVLFDSPDQLDAVEPPQYVVASELNLTSSMKTFLEESYETVAKFGGRRLLPWGTVSGLASGADPLIFVYRASRTRQP
ncbi:MAG: hypothetical protein CO113_17105 [Elusimicrobia bacterium CG_4_9_14_3_um_filter_62_55]|nr:MAG: hypothetical protein CO113_17105 [Elusimicrobia bacterium CG_4_9_14_3_um_filter_62_55]